MQHITPPWVEEQKKKKNTHPRGHHQITANPTKNPATTAITPLTPP